MREPDFWRHNGLMARLLSPLGALYDLAGRIRRKRATPYQAPIPVICIGNLTLGGAGKTPTAINLLQRLAKADIAAHAVTRGYRGSEEGPHRVSPTDSPKRVGDEPLLLAAHAPTWVAKDRAKGVKAAVDAGAEVVVLDDGFQNPAVAKDLSIIVMDGAAGFGNGRVFPAGPLRESVAGGLSRADAVLVMGAGEAPKTDLPILRAQLEAQYHGPDLKGQKVFAFAGIGRPEKFFETVRGLGGDLVDTEAFDDHHHYTGSMANRLLARGDEQLAHTLTTEKDMVKLPASMRGKIWPVPVSLVWEDDKAIGRLLNKIFPESKKI